MPPEKALKQRRQNGPSEGQEATFSLAPFSLSEGGPDLHLPMISKAPMQIVLGQNALDTGCTCGRCGYQLSLHSPVWP